MNIVLKKYMSFGIDIWDQPVFKKLSAKASDRSIEEPHHFHEEQVHHFATCTNLNDFLPFRNKKKAQIICVAP